MNNKEREKIVRDIFEQRKQNLLQQLKQIYAELETIDYILTGQIRKKKKGNKYHPLFG